MGSWGPQQAGDSRHIASLPRQPESTLSPSAQEPGGHRGVSEPDWHPTGQASLGAPSLDPGILWPHPLAPQDRTPRDFDHTHWAWV